MNHKRAALAVMRYLVSAKRPNREVLDLKSRSTEQTRRPGRWCETGDGLLLSQQDTDTLILSEVLTCLWRMSNDTHRQAFDMFAPQAAVVIDGNIAMSQRGGLHSDARVRMLALACWGDRDC